MFSLSLDPSTWSSRSGDHGRRHGIQRKVRERTGAVCSLVLQNVTDIQSPWQNGRAERHGQWVKDRVDLELAAGSQVIETLEDLEALIIELVACKNCWFSRGGYSPAQLVYGRNTRLPA